MSGTSSFYRLGIEHTTGLTGNDRIAGQALCSVEQLRTSKTGSFLTINREVVGQVGNIAHSETVEDMGPRYVRPSGWRPYRTDYSDRRHNDTDVGIRSGLCVN